MTTAAARRTVAKTRAEVVINGAFNIPVSVVDLASFNEWADSGGIPESASASFLDGVIWVDLDTEQLFGHNRVKTRITTVLSTITSGDESGYLFSDGVRLSHEGAHLSTEPDATFVRYEAVRNRRVELISGKQGGFVRLDGSPEVVLEIVSNTSVVKDAETLRELYWKAGVDEFWLVDVREGEMVFDILRRGPKGYTATRKRTGGWLPSRVFGRSFRLTTRLDPLGHPDFTLHVSDRA
jgi:Uma2 family endonuclease